MADGFTVDMSEVNQLAADLGEVPNTAGRFMRSAVEVSARNVKNEAARTVGGRRHFRQAAAAIDYELKTLQAFGVSVIDAEIGYSKSKPAGALGNLVEFGAPGANNNLAPTSDLQKALDATQSDFERGLSKALEDAEAVLRR
jgi:hypothetical protein